jgi:hypothetical protein
MTVSEGVVLCDGEEDLDGVWVGRAVRDGDGVRVCGMRGWGFLAIGTCRFTFECKRAQADILYTAVTRSFNALKPQRGRRGHRLRRGTLEQFPPDAV